MNKLLAVRTRCSKLALGIMMIGTAVTAVASNIYSITPDDEAMLASSKAIQEAASSSGMANEDWMLKAMENVKNSMDKAQTLYSELEQTNPLIKHAKSLNDQKSQESQYETLIFISYSLGDAALEEILSSASGHVGTAIVLRGIPDGMNITEGILRIQKLAMSKDPMPNIVLDPSLFSKYNVTSVPTIIALSSTHMAAQDSIDTVEPASFNQPLSKQSRQEVARVQGLYEPDWLNRRVENGEKGDLGVRGPVEEIAERDLIEVMKERVLAIDWNQKRETAKERFWTKQTFTELSRAPKARTRLIDATVVATADIQTSEGQFVARVGDRVNPLETRPFTQAIIVFDPTDEAQIKMLSVAVPIIEKEPNVGKIVYIATKIDKESGWDNYTALTKQLSAPVYLLTPDVRKRFELEYTPSIITANSTHFIVRELANRIAPENQ
ncbi:TrbC family F-type conjugative pilus assembly protein [Eoetvoesiella caeni]